MEPNWWNGLIFKITSRRTPEFCRSAILISPTSAPKAKDSLPWTPWSRCRLSGKTRWSGGKLEVAGGRPGEPGEPRGRVRGRRLQPASQPVGQDRAARERNAWKVTKIHFPRGFPSISPQCTRWGPNHAADPVVTRWKREPVSFKEKLSFFLQFYGWEDHGKVHGELVVSPSSGRKVLEFVCIQVLSLSGSPTSLASSSRLRFMPLWELGYIVLSIHPQEHCQVVEE